MILTIIFPDFDQSLTQELLRIGRIVEFSEGDNLMKNYRQWYYFVLETYRSRFDELLQVIDQIAFHAMDEKLEFYLKRQFASLTITHQEIADDLNSSREVISRLLKKLESQHRITISRNGITQLKL